MHVFKLPTNDITDANLRSIHKMWVCIGFVCVCVCVSMEESAENVLTTFQNFVFALILNRSNLIFFCFCFCFLVCWSCLQNLFKQFQQSIRGDNSSSSSSGKKLKNNNNKCNKNVKKKKYNRSGNR